MTAQEFLQEFNIVYNNKTNDQGAGWNPKEISIILTLGQEELIKENLATSENTELNKKMLSPLKEVFNTNNLLTSLYPYGKTVTLPANYYYTLRETCKIKFNSLSSCYEEDTVISVNHIDPVTEEFYAINLNNPYKRPYNKMLWRIDSQKLQRDFIGDDTFSIISYTLSYYKKPTPIIVPNAYDADDGTIRGVELLTNQNGITSLLDEDFHIEIINKSVELATKYTKDQLAFQLNKLD